MEEDLVLIERVEGGPVPLGDHVVGVDHVGEHAAGLHDALVVVAGGGRSDVGVLRVDGW